MRLWQKTALPQLIAAIFLIILLHFDYKKIENLKLYMCYYIFTSLFTLVATQVVADGVF